MAGYYTHSLEQLNPEQARAVNSDSIRLMVLASAGTGKTMVSTLRAARLILEAKAEPKSIMMVTFTNKAAHQMKVRLKELVGPVASQVNIGTYHKLFDQLIIRLSDDREVCQTYGIRPDTGWLSDALKRKIARDFWHGLSDEQGLFIQKHNISLQQVMLVMDRLEATGTIRPDRINPGSSSRSRRVQGIHRIAVALWKEIRGYKVSHNLMDVNDILGAAYYILKRDKDVAQALRTYLKHFIVDEVQDANRLQFEVLEILSETASSVTLVGDTKQSIYGFRGADPALMSLFKERHPDTEVISLHRNYRSADAIVRFANRIAELMPDRLNEDLPMTSLGEAQGVVSFHEYDNTSVLEEKMAPLAALLSAGTPPSEIAVLFRRSASAEAIQHYLIMRNIAYQMSGDIPLLEKPDVKMLRQLLRAALSRDDNALEYVLCHSRQNFNWSQHKAGLRQEERLFEYIKFLKESDGPLAEKIEALLADLEALYRLPHKGQVMSTILKDIVSQHIFSAGQPIHSERVDLVIKLLAAEKANPEAWAAVLGRLERINLSAPGLPQTVQLMTVHAAKGLEFPHVILADVDDARHYTEPDAFSVENEERRIFYVAATRAKESLVLAVGKSS